MWVVLEGGWGDEEAEEDLSIGIGAWVKITLSMLVHIYQEKYDGFESVPLHFGADYDEFLVHRMVKLHITGRSGIASTAVQFDRLG